MAPLPDDARSVFLAGTVLTFLGGLAVRKAAGVRGLASLQLDLVPPICVFVILCALTARPWFSGLMVLIVGAAYGYANRSKIRVLNEPIIFTDFFQAIDIFRHPRLALPFPRLAPIALSTLAAAALLAGLIMLEPASWTWRWWHLPLVAAGLLTVRFAVMHQLQPMVLSVLLRMRPAGGSLHDDMHAFGPLGMLLAHGLIARAEREELRSGLKVHAKAAPQPERSPAPVVLVQSESFFDARRIEGVNPDILRNWDRCRVGHAQAGRLTVPCWGGNTVRSEFSILSGRAQEELGYDRFNPYHRLARQPLESLAWAFKRQGYRTICLHPFDGRFYGRDKVMPALGFDEFLDESAMVGAQRVNGFIADEDVARYAERLLRERGPAVFLFIITMENHGPWVLPADADAEPAPGEAPHRLALPPGTARGFGRYLASIGHADHMLALLDQAVGQDGMLGFYGDHLPAFAPVFDQLKFADRRSDYLIRAPGAGGPVEKDIAAHEFHHEFLRIWNTVNRK